jgi:hypothetical protein
LIFYVSGEGLKVCNIAPHDDEEQGSTNTCCTAKMEAALAARSRQEFDQALQNALNGKLAAVLKARATKFDGKTFIMPNLPLLKRNLLHFFNL